MLQVAQVHAAVLEARGHLDVAYEDLLEGRGARDSPHGARGGSGFLDFPFH